MREDRAGRRLVVAEGAQHREPRHVLPGHRDDVERDARATREPAGSKLGDDDRSTGGTTAPPGDRPTGNSNRRPRPPSRPPRPAPPSAARAARARARPTTVRPCHQVSPTEASTGARQMGNRMPASIALAIGFGMRVIARASHGHKPGDHQQDAAEHEGADRRREVVGQALRRDHQSGTRGRPGDRDRHPVAQAERDRQHALHDAEHEQPRCRLGSPSRRRPGVRR